VTATDAICNCGGNAEQVQRFSQLVQWTPLLLAVSIFTCEKPHSAHSVALGLMFVELPL